MENEVINNIITGLLVSALVYILIELCNLEKDKSIAYLLATVLFILSFYIYISVLRDYLNLNLKKVINYVVGFVSFFVPITIYVTLKKEIQLLVMKVKGMLVSLIASIAVWYMTFSLKRAGVDPQKQMALLVILIIAVAIAFTERKRNLRLVGNVNPGKFPPIN